MSLKIGQLLKQAALEIEKLKQENEELKSKINGQDIKKEANDTYSMVSFGEAVENDDYIVSNKNPEATFEIFFGR